MAAVFVYGSNMHLDDLGAWMASAGLGAPSVSGVRRGALEGHRLAWDYRSPSRGEGAADVIRAKGARVPGLVLEVDAATLAAIDQKEGHPDRYARGERPEPVHLEGGEDARAFVYRVTDAWRRPEPVWPSTDYLALLVEAARAHGLPADHHAALCATPSVTSGALVRPMRVEDAPALGRVHVEAWRWAYRGLMPDEVLDGLSAEKRAKIHASAATDARTVSFTALDGDAPVGFAHAGPGRDDDLPPNAAELYAIYLLESALDRGIGRALLERALWPLAGAPCITLWVLEGNTRARRFYERAGFAPDGATQAHPVGCGADRPAVRYRRTPSEGST